MTLEEFEMLTEEQKEQALAYMDEQPAQVVMCRCKPTYNFQSIEFEWEAGTELELEAMFNLYDHIVKKLQEIAPEQPTGNVKKEPKKKSVPATERQLEILENFGIPYDKDITKAEASELIKISMQKAGK